MLCEASLFRVRSVELGESLLRPSLTSIGCVRRYVILLHTHTHTYSFGLFRSPASLAIPSSCYYQVLQSEMSLPKWQ